MKKNKICFVCSSGGHFAELKRLKELADNNDCFLLTEGTKKGNNIFCKKIYYTKEINRRQKLFPLSFLKLCLKSFRLYVKEKPTIIISTGALCAYPMIKIAKILNKKVKVIYIESYARVYDLSTTGKRVYHLADLFFVQWQELKDKYPDTIYLGNVFGEEF